MEILNITPIGDRRWKLTSSFTIETSFGTFTVPKNTETDLASVPRIFWIYLPPFGLYTIAAVVHDYLYSKGNIVSKEIADKVFLEIMLMYKVPKFKANIMYMAVKYFGRGNFKNDR